MKIAADILIALIALIALLHVYILVLEMFFLDKPRGMKAFGNTQQAATATKVFFLLCVAVAGLYGAATAFKKILFIQTVPAAIAMLVLWASLAK